MKLNPLGILAIVLLTAGGLEGGRFLLKANDAYAEAKKEGGDAPAAGSGFVDANADANNMALPNDLAKESGMSPSEFKLLQALQDRRQQLDKRESDIIAREGVVKTADAIVMQRIETLKQVEANIQKLLGQVDEMEQQRLGNLVSVYEKMKPKDAARVWEDMSDDVLLPIASRMKNQSLALILAKVSPQRARHITAKLSEIQDVGSGDARLAGGANSGANGGAKPNQSANAANGANANPQLAGGSGK